MGNKKRRNGARAARDARKTTTTELLNAAVNKNLASSDETEIAAEQPWAWLDLLAFVVVLAGALACATLSIDMLRKMFDQRFSWSLLDATQKRLGRATYSESSLYYTFLEEYARAPSFSAAVQGVLSDNLTEYPDTINPLSRFNIWQEVVIGQLWRSGLKQYVADPLELMIESIWVMQAVSYAGMILLAWYLGGANVLALACGFVAIATYANIAATERMNCFRAIQFPMLRENYSVPFMWYQLWALCSTLRAGARGTLARHSVSVRDVALFVASTLMLTGWQFAPFLVLLQVGALLATYIAGYATLSVVARIGKVLVRTHHTVRACFVRCQSQMLDWIAYSLWWGRGRCWQCVG